MKRVRLGLMLAAVLALGATCESKTNWVYELPSHWPTKPLYPGVGDGIVAITNALDDTITLHDAWTLQRIGSVPIGLLPIEIEGPHHLVVSPDQQFLYAGLSYNVQNGGTGPHGSHGTGSSPGYIFKIRISDMRVVGQTRVDRNPGDLVLSPDGTRIYVSHFDVLRIQDVVQAGGTVDEMRADIAVIDATTMQKVAEVPVCVAEHGITLAPDGTKLYVACWGDDRLAIVDVTQPTPTATFVSVGPSPTTPPSSPNYGPYALTWTPDAKTLWISCWESSDLRAFSTTSMQMDLSRTIATGGNPMFGAVLENDRFVIPKQGDDHNFPDDRLFLFNSAGAMTELPLDSRCRTAHVAYAVPGWPDAILVVCEGHHVEPGSLVMIEASTGAVLASAQTGIYPDSAAWIVPW